MIDFLIRFGQWGMVAGAAEGLGAAFCEELAREGMNGMVPVRVAHFALKKLGRKTMIIPGFSNRMSYFLLTRILPRRMAAALVNRTMGKTYRNL